MPDLPISALPALSVPELADVFPIVNGGITKKTTVQNLGNTIFNQISSSVILPSQTGSFTSITTFNSFTSSVTTTASFNQYTGSVRSYYLSAYHTASMGVAVINTPYTMSFNSTDFSYGISISGSSRDKIKIENSGIYDIQFSAQIDRTDSANSTAYIWIRKNDLDVPISNTGLAVAGGANDANVASWNWFVSASAGDYYQIMYAATDTNTRLVYNPSPTVGPAVPSVILTVDRVG